LQKFLIIQTAFIGDVVLTTPLIEKLHAFYPDAQIDFLLRKGNEQLLEEHPYVYELLIWDKKKNKQKNLLGLIVRIRKNKYDKVINVQRFLATGLLTALSGAKEKIGFDKNPLSFSFSKKIKHIVAASTDNPKVRTAQDSVSGHFNSLAIVHETTRNLELIREFTDSSMFKPKLYPSHNDFAHVEPWVKQQFITVSPASVWFTKQFPAGQWIAFINDLPEGLAVYLLGGPDDKDLCELILRACIRKEIKVLAGSLTYLQSAALMSRSVMNYVNDSAPMHFASAMNAPVTAVYCSTIPQFGFGPLSDISHIVEIEKPLYCRPCGLHGYAACPEKHFRCAKEIRTEQLLFSLTDKGQA
jgi:ADP-heptose:LPS heptosyltransferase